MPFKPQNMEVNPVQVVAHIADRLSRLDYFVPWFYQQSLRLCGAEVTLTGDRLMSPLTQNVLREVYYNSSKREFSCLCDKSAIKAIIRGSQVTNYSNKANIFREGSNICNTTEYGGFLIWEIDSWQPPKH